MDPIVSTVITFVITGLLGFVARYQLKKYRDYKKKQEEHEKEHKRLREVDKQNNISMQLIHKCQIKDIYDKGMERGFLSEHDKELVNELYDNYSQRGGNGYIKKKVEKINNMKEEREVQDGK